MSNTKPTVPAAIGKPWLASMYLTLAMVAIFPLFGYVGHAVRGQAGLLAAIVAGGICWLATLIALWVTYLLQGKQAVNGMLLSMMCRTGVPLLAGLFLTRTSELLAQGGVMGMLVGYYLFGLVVETLLSVRLVASSSPSAKAS